MISLRKGASAVAVLVSLIVSACSDDASTEPLSPGKLSVVGEAEATGQAGYPLPMPFRVQLTTAKGVTLTGHVVRFTAAPGVTLSADSSLTDENGIASVGVTVGPVGTYTVTASADNVAPVTFSATARAAIPAGFFYGAGNNQVGFRGEDLGPVSVFVTDQAGLPAAGVPVNFTVTSGGGSVTTPVLTDANGVAIATYTLGVTGTQTMSASLPGFTAVPFTATFVANPCTAARPVVVPFTRSRALDSTDCQLATLQYAENFDYTHVATAPFQLSQTSSAFTPRLIVLKGADTAAVLAATGTTAAYKLFLTAGATRITASSVAPAATGAYTLTAGGQADVSGCEPAFIMKGANSGAQNIAANDCQLTYNDGNGFGSQLHYGDSYFIYLKVGTAISIVQSGAADHFIRVLNPAGVVVATMDNFVKGSTETLAFTATAANGGPGVYQIQAATFNNNAGGVPPDTGPYVLTVN